MYTLMALDMECPDMLEQIPLREYGFGPIVHRTDVSRILTDIRARKPGAVFLDMDICRDIDSVLIEKISHACACIVLSADADYEKIRKAMRAGAFDYCMKPVTCDKLLEVICALKYKLDGNQEKDPALSQNERIDRIRAYIQSHLGEKLTLTRIAGEFYMSRNYLCTFFRKHLGLTFVDYLTAERVKRVKALLATPLSLAEIAEKTGFSDTPYFIKVFKKIEGVAPGAYRRSLHRQSG
jgi:two-component system response regulator YesN